MKDLRELERYRDVRASLFMGGSAIADPWSGVFAVPVPSSKRPLRIIATAAECPGSHGWDHVSISLPARCPTWAEMDHVKRLFFYPHEVAFQLHPQESHHISNHPYCLHIWRPGDGAIPLPPPELVGLPGIGELTPEQSRHHLSTLRAIGLM